MDIGIHVGDVAPDPDFGRDAGEFVHEGMQVLEIDLSPDIGQGLNVATGCIHQSPAELPALLDELDALGFVNLGTLFGKIHLFSRKINQMG